MNTAKITSEAPALAAEHIAVRYETREVIHDLSVSIEPGTITTFIGPNGCGKSTLLKSLSRIMQVQRGAVYIDGVAISTLSSTEVARRMAMLPQSPVAPEELTVGELVEQGRYPHAGPLRMLGKQDHEAIRNAMRLTGMLDFSNRMLSALSGGERQRAWIALALAQDTPTLLLDEPTTYLDIGHQLEVLDLARHLNAEFGMTIVMVLHDINQAVMYSDRLVAIQKGQIVADGTPAEVLTENLLAEVFKVRASLLVEPTTGRMLCLPFATVPETPAAAERLPVTA
jgi:iron complex transport system ATP-binding protein